MVLPGVEQEVQKSDPRLGIEEKSLQYLLDLTKGRVYNRSGDWFYKLFLTSTVIGVPKTVWDIRECIQGAWWIEEEDIRQQIYLIILHHNIPAQCNIIQYIARYLRDWLISDQKIFARQTSWQEKYIYEEQMAHAVEPNEPKKLDMVIQHHDVLGLFDTYLAYLAYELKLPRQEICKALLCDPRQANRLTEKLRKKMEDIHARTKNTSRHCYPSFAVFGCGGSSY